MNIFLQLLVNGLVAGSIYSLVAIGFSLVYHTNKFVHFAHGGIISISGYFLFWLCSGLGINFYLAVPATIIFSGLLGLLINAIFYKPLRRQKANNSVMLLSSLAALIILQSLALLIFGPHIKIINLIQNDKVINIIGVFITNLQILIIATAVLLFFVVSLFLKKSKIGSAMRAVADNRELAEAVGISTEKIYNWSFFIASAIAGVAAILISLEQNIWPNMGTDLMIKGFAGSVIGGLESVPGAVLGSILLGLSENFGIWFLPSGYKDAITFSLLFVFLLLRPQGILRIKK